MFQGDRTGTGKDISFVEMSDVITVVRRLLIGYN